MNIRQVRKKIKTIGNIKKITRAMELVSAVKMKKSQQEAVQTKPYQQTLDSVIKKITKMIDPSISTLLNENPVKKTLVIFISTNKGLCGSFNFNLFRFAFDNLQISQTDFITIGKLGSFFVNKQGGKIIADYSTYKPDMAVSAIHNLSVSKYLAKEYQRIYLVYNRFISSVKHQPVIELLLPIKIESDLKPTTAEQFIEGYQIEPEPELIIDSLLNNFVEEKIRSAIISSQAGEHSARMLAMKNATDNANQLIDSLTLTRNQLRQEKITYELLDMITAKESVETVKN